MDIEEVIEKLKEHGHTFGDPAISHDGFILLNIDGKLMRYDEARELLATIDPQHGTG